MPDIDPTIIASLELDVATLERLFGKEENYGIVEEDTGDGALWPDGTRWSTCTNWANMVHRVLGERAQTLGFSDEENPDSIVAELYGGHDFSLIDDRYVCDGWLREVAGMSERIVFDLNDPNDAAEIAKFYGLRDKWGISGMNSETPHMRAIAMSSSRFQDIVDQILSEAPKPGL